MIFFDFIVCSHVLGHVNYESKAIDEMNRILKPGGSAFIMTLINHDNADTLEIEGVSTPEERLKHYTEPDLQRLHGRDFADRLAKGFGKVEIIDYRKNLEEEICRQYSLGNGDREIIFKCSK